MTVRLSQQERRILSLAAEGLTSKEIAEKSGISKYTVDDHVASAMRKLGVASRVAAVAEAPAPRGGVGYCIDRFIPMAQVCLGRIICSRGDTRTSPDPSCDRCYRVRILIDGEGNREVQVGTSETNFGPFGTRTGTANAEHCDTETSCAISHGVLSLAPPIYTEIKFSEDGQVSAYGTPFPSLEVWRYSEGSDPELVYFWDALAAGTNVGHLFPPFYQDLPNMHVAGGGSGGRLL